MRYSSIIVILVSIVASIIGACKPNNAVSETRNLEYEAYVDSIYEANPDYYLDVIVEGDEFQKYIEINGQWWD